MAEERGEILQRPRRGGRGLSGAIILIIAGVALLLQNLGIIHIDWLSLWRYWPVLLILLGLDVLLGRSIVGSLVVALLSLVVVGALVFGVGIRNASPDLTPGDVVPHTIEEDLNGAETLSVEIELGAADAQIGALEDERMAARGEFRANERLQPQIAYSVQGDRGRLTIGEQGREYLPFGLGFTGRLDLALNSNVPLDLTIQAGAGDLTLDLTEINLRSLTIKGGIGSITLILPSQGAFTAEISTGVGSFAITVPDELSALIEVDSGLGSADVPTAFVRQEEGLWATPAYSAAEHAMIHISMGVGSVDIQSR